MAIIEGRDELLPENIMNLVVFIPVGLLIGVVLQQRKWWKILIIGCGISIVIETFQFLFMKGFSELDDVMHNTLGCMIGYGIYSLVRVGYERISERNMAIL